mmetsp:Transcript_387/g.694  ORF Transcript_387/g.694 Transcript_387/m.694 type:complete len:208 (+) Transcript_387:56-679(+)
MWTKSIVSLVALLLAENAVAFSPLTLCRPSSSVSYPSLVTSTTVTSTPRQSSMLQMSDFDFPSAMPEKPQLTMEQRLEKSADDFVENMTNALGEGVEAPPELELLKQARANNDVDILPLRIYELMIERGMRYDEAPETGTLTPTEFDIPANLDVKEVQAEFKHLYSYGMTLMDKGLLTQDQVKTTVIERLIKRTGLTPEEFDKWLGY